ncbi:MAG: hypothetical protein K6F43_01430 [Prevotella sp.]|nr:hypothetical protein [Prevotella sp.]
MNNLIKNMHRIVILLFVLASAINMSAQTTVPIDTEHFPDEGFRNYVNDHATPDNISSIARFTINDDKSVYNIKDLQGIEYFTSLIGLAIYSCNITNTDLSNIPNLRSLGVYDCPELISLSMTGHSQIAGIGIENCKKLSVAHLSNNPNLGTLTIQQNPNLQQIELDGNTALREIKLWQPNNAPMTAYDFSMLTNLEYLSFNNLEELNLAGNAKLKHLDTTDSPNLLGIDVSNNVNLEALWLFGVSNLASLDVRNNTQLKDLRINSRQMTSLDVTKNTNLEFLLVMNAPITSLDVSANQKLTSLFLDSLQLTGINLSNNDKLKEFRCIRNNITALDFSNNPALSSIDCNSNQLTCLDVSNNPELTTLNCSNNLLTSLDLQQNTNINNILFFMNNIKEDAMTLLINSLPSTYGNFCVLYPEGDDGNVFNYDHYQLVKSKRWTPYYMELVWFPYQERYDYAKREITDKFWEGTHIQTIGTDKQINPVYNLHGQKVDASYHGIVIKNGTKGMQGITGTVF